MRVYVVLVHLWIADLVLQTTLLLSHKAYLVAIIVGDECLSPVILLKESGRSTDFWHLALLHVWERLKKNEDEKAVVMDIHPYP